MKKVLLLLVFLSSAAHGEGNRALVYHTSGGFHSVRTVRVAVGDDLSQSPRSIPKAEPVPYAGLDISRVFDPRHDLYMLQLESLRHEDVAETITKRVRDRFDAYDDSQPRPQTWWEKLSSEQKVFFWLVIVVILMTIYGLLKFNRDKPNLTGKR